MAQHVPEGYRATAERSWRWVLDQVRWDDGPWIPHQVTDHQAAEPPWDRDGTHSGIGGLAHALAEIRLLRAWTGEEQDLADAIAERVRNAIPAAEDCSLFDGLVAHLGVLSVLDAPGAAHAVARLRALAGPQGWPLRSDDDRRIEAGACSNDLTLGTAGVLLGALWCARHGVAGSSELADRAARLLLAEAEQEEVGLTWRMVPPRHFHGPQGEMPGLSHGVAGVATVLALAGRDPRRPDLLAAAVAGTSLLFLALRLAGVAQVAGRSPLTWHRRCLYAVRHSGLPARLYPGFWDNDGRCCGTAGVGDIFLDEWHRTGHPGHLRFAVRLADALLQRGISDGPCTYWRFLEHRADDPQLPPGTGWMQGAAGIATYLFRVARVLRDGDAAAVAPRMDNWWALEP